VLKTEVGFSPRQHTESRPQKITTWIFIVVKTSNLATTV